MPETIYKEDEVVVSTEDLRWPIYSYELGCALYKVLKYVEKEALKHEHEQDVTGLKDTITLLKNEVHKLTGAP